MVLLSDTLQNDCVIGVRGQMEFPLIFHHPFLLQIF